MILHVFFFMLLIEVSFGDKSSLHANSDNLSTLTFQNRTEHLNGSLHYANNQINQYATDVVRSIVERLNEDHHDYSKFSQTLDSLDKCENTKCFTDTLTSAVRNDSRWEGSQPQELIIKLRESIEIHNSLVNGNDEEMMTQFKPNINLWGEPLREWLSSRPIVKQLWLDFTSNIRDTLSSYKFHANRPSSQPQTISELLEFLPRHFIDIVPHSIVELLNQTAAGQGNSVITGNDIKLLWEMVAEAFEKREISECSTTSNGVNTITTMTISGTFIKASDFTHPNGFFINCTNVARAPNVLRVFATRVVFLDRNVSPSKQQTSEFAIVSPTVEVIIPGVSQRTKTAQAILVDLSGSFFAPILPNMRSMGKRLISGRTYTAPKIPYSIETQCAEFDPMSGKVGKRGKPGRPGIDGMPGGNFILISENVVNLERLKVTVKGGNGGDGEDGADGGEGKMGAFFPFSKWKNKTALAYAQLTNPYPCEVVQEYNWKDYHDDCWTEVLWDLLLCRCALHCKSLGCPGGFGGDGGNGGSPGRGGRGGSVQIINLQAPTSGDIIQVTREKAGESGRGGKGGMPGRGGDRGNGDFALIPLFGDWSKEGPTTSKREEMRSPYGDRGVDYKNTEGPPESPLTLTFDLTPLNILLGYKRFTIPINSPALPPFFKRMDSSDELGELYSPLDFAEELLLLEEVHLEMRNNNKRGVINSNARRDLLALTLLPHYDSFISRLDKYFRRSVNRTISLHDKKLLSLVYSAALSQARTLRQVYGTPVIIDVKEYLNFVERRLKDYSKTETLVLVTQEKERYNSSLNEKIWQASKFIADTVEPTIKKAQDEIDLIRVDLEKKVREMIVETNQLELEYKEAVETMKTIKQIRGITNAVKWAGAAVSMFGGKAELVGKSAIFATGVVENLIIPSTPNVRPLPPLPNSVKSISKEFRMKTKAIDVDRSKCIRILINRSKVALEENKEWLAETPMSQMINVLEASFNNLQSNGTSMHIKEFRELERAVQQAETNLTKFNNKTFQEIQDQIERNRGTRRNRRSPESDNPAGNGETENQPESSSNNIISKLSSANLAKAADSLTRVHAATVQANKMDDKELEKYEQLAADASDQLKDLRGYEQSMKDVLVPAMDNIISDMESAADKLGKNGNTQASVRVEQWKVGNILRKFTFLLQKMTEGFPTEFSRRFALEIETLQDGMNLMIDLYSFIEKYQEQITFADYIANINDPVAKQNVIQGRGGVVYNKIERAMKASVLLREWDAVSQTIQQWSFPFAATEFPEIFKTDGIPDFISNTTVEIYDTLLPDITKRVKALTDRVTQGKSTINTRTDPKWIHRDFHSSYDANEPFFVWKYDVHSEKINQLLCGQKVTLSATPDYAYHNKMAAVKFTTVEIEPKASNDNTTVQKELNQMLDKLRVEMTHSGISKYLYEDTHYEMIGEMLPIEYNFQRNGNGDRDGVNTVYQKLKNGDVIISPYTQWTVQLKDATTRSKPFNFTKLAQLSQLIDIELKGNGKFVRVTPISPTQIQTRNSLHYRNFQVDPPFNISAQIANSTSI